MQSTELHSQFAHTNQITRQQHANTEGISDNIHCVAYI